MRIKPTKGGGIAMNSAKDKVGVFVDAETGNVGIGHSQPKAELHVEGTAYASGPIEAAGGDGISAESLS